MADSAPKFGLAPEMSDIVAAARIELSRVETIGGLQNDPLHFAFRALSIHLDAMHKMFLDGTLILRQEIEAARQPVRDDEMRSAVIQGIGAYANQTVRGLNWRTLTVAVIAALIFGAACGGAGWWFGRGSNVTFADVPMEARSAAAWHSLIGWNADVINGALADCTVNVQHGRKTCGVPLWIEPPVSPR